MDYLDRGEHPSDAWKTQQLALVQHAQEQEAQLLIMVAPAIQKLIDSSTVIMAH
jgi:murein endopeptidase